MGRKCSVHNCHSNYDRRKNEEEKEKVPVYGFPLGNKLELATWLQSLPNKIEPSEVTVYMGVCALHWPDDAPYEKKARHYVPGVPPSIFPSVPDAFIPSSISKKPRSTKKSLATDKFDEKHFGDQLKETVAGSAQALVSLKGLGSPQRMGHYPARIRKKNSKFFNDDEQTDYQPSHYRDNSSRAPKRRVIQAPTPSVPREQVVIGIDKRAAQSSGLRLRNLLKLPKAHKWVCYEWFYSNIDAPLFMGENDFCICMRESFPFLKCTKLRRVEWNKIRRLMGKPRRCSPAFLSEERAVLEDRREKIRMLQQRKSTDVSSIKDLPQEIPFHLVVGTKVTARLRKPQDGLFTGTIAALDTVDNSYRVTFDRPGLGTHSIPDYEVLSDEPPDSIPITAFQEKPKRGAVKSLFPLRFIPGSMDAMLQSINKGSVEGFRGSMFQAGEEADPDAPSPFKGKLVSLEGGTYGGFPIKFLVLVTRLSKILQVKKDWINQLSKMNTVAEKKSSFEEPITFEFQRDYASIVVELEKLNKDLNEYLNGVQTYYQDISPDQGVVPTEQPSEIKKKCDDEAVSTVRRICVGMLQNKRTANNERVLKLISDLTSIMLQIRTFSENEYSSYEFGSLQESLQCIKANLDANNINVFQNNVEIHINHIQTGLSQMGNLHAFASSSAPSSSAASAIKKSKS